MPLEVLGQDLSPDPKAAQDPRARFLAVNRSVPEGTPTPLKRWTVTMDDGTVYRGVMAPTAQDAMAKMVKGPQGPLAPQPSAPENVVAREKAKVLSGIEDILKEAGKSPEEIERTKARIGGKLPNTPAEALGALVPLGVGALIPSGRTATRVVGQVLGNILGSGAVYAGTEALAPTEEGVVGAGLRGALRGVLPGVAQGALGAAFGPTRATLKAQKAIPGIQATASQEVAKVLSSQRPGELFTSQTIRRMERAAGKNLDTMEAKVGKALEGLTFTYQEPGTNIKLPLPFDAIRARIKSLRAIDPAAREVPLLRGLARQRQQQAQHIEGQLLTEMRQQGHLQAVELYKSALRQHRIDSDVIRYVRGIQERQAGPGGVNLMDRPGLGQAEKALVGGALTPRGIVHGALGVGEAATGRPIGAGYHLGRLADTLQGSRLVPALRTPNARLLNLPGAAAGSGVAIGQNILTRDRDETP